MTALEFIDGALTRTRDATLRVSDGLTREELLWQPSPKANHIGFLLWHIGRVEDMWVNRFARSQPEVWEAQGWYEKCGGPVREIGYGFDAEQVQSLPIPELGLLQDYLEAVRHQTLDYLRGLSPEALVEVPRPNRPEMTIGRVFIQFISHENQHLGAIEYLRGLQRDS